MGGQRGRHTVVAAGFGFVLGLLAIGPGLAPGFVLSYDMVFVPRPRLSEVTFGLTGMLPRHVPSDAFAAVLSQVLPADVAQKAILLAIFTLACAAASMLVPSERLTPRLAAGVVYAWNPFVAERLLLGHWALLLGYAGLPLVVLAAARGEHRRLVLALLPAAIGGFAAWAVSGLTALVIVACRRRLWPLLVTAVILPLVALPWLVPGLVRTAPADPAGVAAFAARADTPFGALGSLLLLGGGWNAETVPGGYGGAVTSVLWLLVVAAALLAYAKGPRIRGAAAAAVVGFAVAALGAVAPALLRGAIGLWPAFGVLRDGQQYVAPLAVVVAAGAGFAVERLAAGAGFAVGRFAAGSGPAVQRLPAQTAPAQTAPAQTAPAQTAPAQAASAQVTPAQTASAQTDPAQTDPAQTAPAQTAPAQAATAQVTPAQTASAQATPAQAGSAQTVTALPGVLLAPVLLVSVLLIPILLLPGLAWGAGGRLRAVHYPADWARARAVVAGDPGDVVVLPWAAYRGYPWNHGRRVLDPLPRYLPGRVIVDDGVRVAVRGGTGIALAAEDPRARELDSIMRSGAPLTAALAARGVRYVALDAGVSDARLAGAQCVVAGAHIALYRISTTVSEHEPHPARLPVYFAWFITFATFIFSVRVPTSNLGERSRTKES